MGIVTEHALGAPCWFELVTTDQAAAKQFYTELFGWSVNDFPMGPNEHYTMFQLGGHDVSAAYTLQPKLREQGVAPHWAVYFSAPDLDEVTTKVQELGGSVLAPPFDVMEVGRMSVCKDPGDANFSLWKAKRHKGVGVLNEDNAVCWTELATWDVAKARAFYMGLFGWEAKGSPNMPTYIEFSVGGRPRGGLMGMDDQWKGIPSHWGIYFMVADCDVATSTAKDLGATVRHGPFDAPGVGRMSMVADPQGAGFSLITLKQAA